MMNADNNYFDRRVTNGVKYLHMVYLNNFQQCINL